MGTSLQRDLHIDQNLTQVALNYRPANMIADMIAPIVNVSKETDIFPVYSRAEILALESTLRARGTEARKITRSVSSRAYTVKNYALGHDVFLEDRVNIDAAYEAELYGGAAQYVTGKLMLDWENRILNQVNSASNVSTGFTVNSAWTVTNGDPISHIFGAMDQLQATTGMRPNSILFGYAAWNKLRRNVNVRNIINGTNNGGGLVTRQQIQNVFEVDKLLVSEVFINTANEAQAEALTSPMANNVLLYYAPPNPSREVPSFMYSFRWSAPGLPNMVVERHPFDSRKKVETIEVGYYQDEQITGSDYGALIRSVNVSTGTGLT